jgi:hypothetical protein
LLARLEWEADLAVHDADADLVRLDSLAAPSWLAHNEPEASLDLCHDPLGF